MTPDDYRELLLLRAQALVAELSRENYEGSTIREIALDIMAILDDEDGK